VSDRETKLAHGMAAAGGSRLAALGLSLALNAILARVLTPGEFAFFGVLISLLTIGVLVAQGGYQTGIVKSVGEAVATDPTGRNVGAALSAGLLATAIGSVAVIALTGVFAGTVLPPINGQPVAGVELMLVLAMIPLMSFNVLLAEALRGAGRVGWAASVTALGQHGGVVRAGLLLGLVAVVSLFGPLHLRQLLVLSVLSSALVVAFIAGFIHRKFQWSRDFAGGWIEMRRSLSLNLRFLIGQFAQMLSGQYVVTIVSGMIFSGQVLAMFVAAQSLRVLLQAPHTLFAGAVPSLMIDAHRRSEHAALEDLLRYGSSMALAMTLAIILPFIALGPWVFAVLFGPGYADAYFHFLSIAPGLIGVTFGGTAARALLLLGHERLYLRIALTASLVAPPVYVIAGTAFGPIGLGLASSVVLAGQQLAAVLVAHRVLGVWSHARLDPEFYLKTLSKISNRATRKAWKT
jgi:O-antigen/teichoic acid export membrane protein